MSQTLRLKATDYAQVANMRYLTLFKYGDVKRCELLNISRRDRLPCFCGYTFYLVRDISCLIFNDVEKAFVVSKFRRRVGAKEAKVNVSFVKDRYSSVDEQCLLSSYVRNCVSLVH